MVPAAFVELDELPKTVQGKLDKAALPPPPAARPEWAGRCRPARDAHESLLVEVWQELLEIDPIGIEDDFFELGGHSMLAVRMVAEVEKRSGVAIPLAALFRRPTIEHLAELLRHPQKSGPAAALIGLNQQTTGTPLFCIHPAGGTVFCYRELADHLQQRRPVYGLQARGVDGRDEPHRCLVEMAGYYADAIRQICPEGPCELLGWSIGGNIAFEVARQLQESGVQIEALNLLDSGLLQESGPLREDDFLPLIAALFPGEEHLPLDQLRQLSREEQLKYFVGRASRAGIVPIDNELLGMQIFSVFQANVKAVHEYQPVPYPGPADPPQPPNADRRTV
jgi:thioesterase domain-containing protein/acyl carrier protein